MITFIDNLMKFKGKLIKNIAEADELHVMFLSRGATFHFKTSVNISVSISSIQLTEKREIFRKKYFQPLSK